ncbi:MAG: hypothetical protein K9G49_04235 [Taibaiella sp.]|nr:hypothetical protein [Taibaiella sp.]
MSQTLYGRVLMYVLLCCSQSLQAQEYSMRLHSWGTKDGLSDRLVNDICQDKHGIIWVCTKNGLNRFDGYTFKVYNTENSQLPFDQIFQANTDVNGELWLLGPKLTDNNICIFDPLTKQVATLKDKTGYTDKIRATFMENAGDSMLFFGNVKEQLFFVWHPVRGLRKLKLPLRVRTLMGATEKGTFFVEGFQRKLFEIDMDGAVIKQVQAPFVVRYLHSFSPRFGAFLQDSITEKVYQLSPGLGIADFSALLPPEDTTLGDYVAYAGIDSFLWRQGKLWHPRLGVFKDFGKGKRGERMDLFRQKIIDKNNRIWGSSDFGLYMLSLTSSKFKKYFYRQEDSNFHNSFRNITVHNGSLYTVNEFTGLQQLDLGNSNIVDLHYDKPGISRGYVLTSTKEGGLFGLQSKYSYSLEPGSNKWTLQILPASFNNYKCWYIRQVSKDSFLLGTNMGLVWYLRKENNFTPISKYGSFNEVRESMVTSVIRDRDGQEWILSNAGLFMYNSEKGITARYSNIDSGTHFLPAKEFHFLYQDAAGVFWLGTGSGLLKWEKDRNTYKLYTRKSGLSNNTIYAIYEDRHDRLWLSSDFGIIQFSKRGGTVKTYTTDDGITNNEFNRISHFRDSSGNIYFGSLNGVTCFNPDSFPVYEDPNNIASLVVTSFEQFNGNTNTIEDLTAKLSKNNTITLQPGDRFFTINFALLNYTDVIHNSYYWRIEGVDTAWNTIREPSLRISGLPYGNHQLHIKAQASDGSWGGNDLLFFIRVNKPFYLRGWFILLTIASIISAFALWFKWRVYSLKKENERLDRIVLSKTNELEDTIKDLQLSTRQKDVLMKEIHHRVKNNIQIISSLLKMELANVHDERARKSIEEGISRISSIGLIHQHLYKGDDLTSIEFGEFVAELNKQVAGIYQQRGQSISFETNIPETFLDIDTALPMGLILNELMTNSYKYTFRIGDNNKMVINLSIDGDLFRLDYIDFGHGLPVDYGESNAGSLGMLIINGLAKQLGGYFSYNRDERIFVVFFKDTLNRKKSA